MNPFPNLRSFIYGCLRNRLAWICVFLHAAWFFLAIANMSPPNSGLAQFLQQGGWSSATILAGRPFHFAYESIPLKLLFLVDLPSAFAAIPFDLAIGQMAGMTQLSFNTRSYITATELLLFATVQWLVIGSAVCAWLESKRRGTLLIQRLNRHFVVIISVILMLTVFTTPIVNRRSRELGFRRGAISLH
jgi:hypothetical protein